MKPLMREASAAALPKLAAPAQRALAGAGITDLHALSQWWEREVAALHGIGGNALKQLRDALQRAKLDFTKTEPV